MQENKNMQMVSPANMNYPMTGYRDDTIDLIDILIKLIKRKYVILWSMLFSVFCGVIMLMLLSPVYSYVTAIEIGSQMTENGTPVFFENAQTVKSKLVTAFIPQVLLTYASEHPENKSSGKFKIAVSVPKGSQLIVLSAKGTQSQSEALLQIEQKIIDMLSKNHGRILSIIRSSIVKDKAEAEAELAYLKNDTIFDVPKKKLQAELIVAETQYQRIKEPDLVESKRRTLKNKLKTIQNKLGLLIDQNKKLKIDANSLKKSELRMTEKVKAIQLQIQLSLNKREQATEDVKDPTQAMTLLMIDSQIQNAQQFLIDLEQRLYVDTQDKLSELQVSIKDNRRKQEAMSAKISKVELDIQNFDKELALESAPAHADVDRISAELAGMNVDRQRNIEQQLQKILDLNIQIDNLSPTRAVSPPMQSLKPQGMGGVKLMAIFIFLGAVIGFALVLALEMAESAKERIAGLEAKS